MELDFDRCYRAFASRDARFDGWFTTAVTSTGVYCRPSCPATTARRENVRFYPSAAAAQRAGFRACKRCRPDAAPGSPEWDVRADVVARAMRLIADGVVDRDGVPGLASRLGYTTRHLTRMLTEQLGAGPLALARAQRAQTARILIETTRLGLAEIAFAAGFGSVRQFNDTLREVYAAAPSELRRSSQNGVPQPNGTISLRLPYRAPLHATALLEFLASRAIRGVERVTEHGYERALALPHGPGEVRIEPATDHMRATLHLTDMRDLAPAVARCRRLLDLDADPVAVDAALAEDLALAPLIAKEPGVRVPRAVDGFEIAMRAIVGQQVSVAGARTVLARLVSASAQHVDRAGAVAELATTTPGSGGAPAGGADELVPFPLASQVAELPDDAFPMPATRRETIRTVARAVASGELQLDGGADRAETQATLLAIPGIGDWTADYVAMRALGDPDVFLPTDLGARRGAKGLGLPDKPAALKTHAERWRPWRSYALIRLWRS